MVFVSVIDRNFRGCLKLLKSFLVIETVFLLAQLVSVERLPAFSASQPWFQCFSKCPNAFENFKCIAWHVSLEFLLDKERTCESVWEWVFYERLWKLFYL